MADSVETQLAAARESLLDLSLRNRLLNFRPTRRTTIRVVDELPGELWRLLVVERKKMAFLALEEHELYGKQDEPEAAVSDAEKVSDTPGESSENGDMDSARVSDTFSASDTAPDTATEEPEAAAPEPDAAAQAAPAAPAFSLPDARTAFEAEGKPLPERYTDLFLQTDLSGPELQANLLGTYRAATSALDERGVNLLFLAVGFLRWRHPEQPDRVLRAPIVMVPVELQRTSAKVRFRLAALDDEPVINPCLVRKLADDGLAAPAPPESWDEFDCEAYLAAMAEAVAGRAGWQVAAGEVCLGLFSFNKYLMYVDLDPARWPPSRPLTGNRLIRSLCGDAEALAADEVEPVDPAALDELLDPEQVFQVLDADSSQQASILQARRGASLVIEGPPGTGKSQTISNVIAECLAAGKTVLFVSQKMAALQVVQRRLEAAGLGEFCLELHSTKANRRAALEELRRSMHKLRPPDDGPDPDAAALRELRRRLNGYVAALHAPFGAARMTPFDCIGRAALLHAVPDIDCPLPGHAEWDRDRFDALRGLLERLVGNLQVIGLPAEHAWRGARIAAVSPQTTRQAAELLARAAAAVEAAGEVGGRVAGAMGGRPAADVAGLRALLAAARLLIESPGPDAGLLAGGLWADAPAEVDTFAERAAEFGVKQAWIRERYDPAVGAATDWRPIRDRMLRRLHNPLRFVLPSYWADRKQLLAHRLGGRMPGGRNLTEELDTLVRLQTLVVQMKDADVLAETYFGSFWRREETDWAAIQPLAKWLRAYGAHAAAGRIGPAGAALAAAGADRAALAADADALTKRFADWREAWDALRQLVSLDEPEAFPDAAEATPLADLLERLRQMADGVESLLDWAQYQETLAACRATPLAAFVDRALADELEPELLPVVFEKRYLQLLLEGVFAERDALRRFSGVQHDAAVDAFIDLDRRWIERSRQRLYERLAAKRPSDSLAGAPSSQLGILQGEIRRKRGGRPIRRLLRDAADILQTLRPCLMMSPLSVAQFLDPEGMRFDVVIFDEASQVEPADALGAIARGGQLLLVGDPKQLPPTNFFNVMSGEAAPADEQGAAALADLESILDRGAICLPTVRLRWHYRSRHESLIEFSNREFYDGELVVFPSSHAAGRRLGLAMQYEPADRYDRGRSQTNRDQARRIAAWVFEHARMHSDKSLGVGAFSQAQQQAILDEIEALRREDDSLESFFARDAREPFFVKNLETIQGDERDVILLSVGYGKTDPAERLRLNLGPLTRDGGWRRLNVLITRARERCVVFSSVLAEDFDLSGTQAVGVHALRGYLEFARSREEVEARRAIGEFASAFQQAVYNALTEQGVSLHRRVGSAGYEIDLAVLDPSEPGRYVLGIECDGPSYQRSATARDRDRLRLQVLEGLGWRIHRIWSPDWYRKPESEIQRAMDAIRMAKAGRLHPRALVAEAKRQRPAAPPPEPPAEADESAPAVAREAPPPVPTVEYVFYTARRPRKAERFYTDPLADLAEAVEAIVGCEGPIHADLLGRRLLGFWRISRAGTRLQQRVREAVAHCLRRRSIRQSGEFLWPADMTDPPIRRREDASVKDADLICPEEITRAACLLLAAQFGMSRDDLIIQTARVFGFQSTSAKQRARFGDAIAAAVAAGRIIESGGVLKAAE